MKYKGYNWYVPVLSAMLFLVGCNVNVNAQQEASTVKTVTVSELLKLREQGVKVVDVRTPGEVAEGKIPGADHIEIGPDFIEKMKKYTKDEPVVVYCRSGGRSAQAASMLKKEGYRLIYNYSGGITDWQSTGQKME